MAVDIELKGEDWTGINKIRVPLDGGGTQDFSIGGGSPTINSLSVTPSETQQTFNSSSVDGYKPVTVGAISSTYIGSGITQRTSSDLSASGDTVTAPAGYYASQATKTVASGTEGTPTATKSAVSNHALTVTPSVTNSAGYIEGGTKTGTAVSVSASELVSGTKSITQNGNNIDVTDYASVNVSVSGGSPNLEIKTRYVTATETQQTAVVEPDDGYDGLEKVNVIVNAIPNTYVGSGITRRTSTDLTNSGSLVSVPSGYYENAVSRSVDIGSVSAPSYIDESGATIYASGNTLTLGKYAVTNSPTIAAGYVSSATNTETDINLSATANILTAGTITPTTTAQTIPANTWIKGAQTIEGIVCSNLTAGNIKKDVVVKIGTATDDDSVTTITGTLVSGGGVGTLLNTTSLGAFNTTSTTATDTGKSLSVSGINSYDALIVETSVDTVTNNRHTCTVAVILLAATSTRNTKSGGTIATVKQNYKISSSSVTTVRTGTNAYGIYPNSVTISNGTATIPMYIRYNSTNTGTINGTYTARVYGLNLYDLIGG